MGQKEGELTMRTKSVIRQRRGSTNAYFLDILGFKDPGWQFSIFDLFLYHVVIST